MSGRLAGRVAIITGAGQGLGAAYALAMARQGAKVVLNDLSVGLFGEEQADQPVVQVAEQIRAMGGEAVIDGGDVANYHDARQMVRKAVDSFGRLDILVNNAGILRDRMLVNMTPREWDDVIRVHLRGHFCTTKHAAAYWREQTKADGKPSDRVLIQTSSIAGLHGNIGQTNYSTAKSGIATMAFVNHLELNQRLGVRAYALAPSARTRLTLNSPGAADSVKPVAEGEYDPFSPDHVGQFVAWLSAAGCPAPSGSVYGVEGDIVRRYDSWHVATTIRNGRKDWSMEDFDAQAADLSKGADRAFQPITEVIAQS